MTEFLKKDKESDIEYLLRLVGTKLKEKPDDLEWQDIVDYTGIKCHYDSLRKAMQPEFYGAYAVYEYMQENMITDDYVLKQLDEKKADLYKMKTRNADYVRLKRQLLRDDARADELKEILEKSIKTLPQLDVEIIDKNITTKNSAVLMLSDVHYGLNIENYWNKYNDEIARERIDKLTSETVKYCKNMNVTDLYLANLNDLISGGIHLTTRIQESVDAIQQSIIIAEIISNMMISIQNKGIKVHYASVTDNHSRRHTAWRESEEKSSFTIIIDEFIRLRTEGKIDIIDNIYDESISYFEVGERRIFAMHGHRDKPALATKNMIEASGIVPTHILMGHYHSKSMFERADTKLFVNGSVVGVDTYAKDNRYFNKPSQTLLIFDDGTDIDIDIKL